MALALVHAFSSGKADGTDNTLVQPSNWNAQHTLTLNGNSLVGNATAGNAAATEIACTAQGRAFLAGATLADLIAAGFPFFSTGDIKFTIKTAADVGWMLFNDGTIGNDTSGASLASTALAAALYTLIWNNISNTWAPILDSTGAFTTRGASAAADFAASKRVPLTRVCGRALGVAGIGAGLTARALGQILGEENHQLTPAELASHTHTAAVTDLGHGHPVATFNGAGTAGNNGIQGTGQANNTQTPSNVTAVPQTTGITVANGSAGTDTPHNNMQPTTFLNAMIKL